MDDHERTSNKSPPSDCTDVTDNQKEVVPARQSEPPRSSEAPGPRGGSSKDPSMRFRASWSMKKVSRRESEKETAPEMKAIFVDPDTMKEKVRDKLVKRKVYNVADYYKTTGPWQFIARHRAFENVTLGVIGVNAVWIAVDTDYNGAEILTDADTIFQVMENLFCGFFSLELLVRFMAFEKKVNACRDMWFVFDSSLVTVMVLETWVMTIIFSLSGAGGSGGLGDTSILRIARLLRLSRMARMARLLRAMPELMVMIKGMFTATRSVFFTLCLLTIIMYVFAIALTQLMTGTEAGNEHFESVTSSMKTLLIYGTLLDSVGVITGKMEGFVLFVFLFYVLLAALTVLNMLVGVLCEVVSAVAATEREENLVCYVKAHIEKLIQELDADGDGTISKNEFVHILDNAQAIRALSEVGVDPIELVDFADYIFEDFQENGHQERELRFDEFMRMVLQLRGSNTATVKDIIDLRKFVRHTSTETYKSIDVVSHSISGLERRMESYFDALSKGRPLPAVEPKKIQQQSSTASLPSFKKTTAATHAAAIRRSQVIAASSAEISRQISLTESSHATQRLEEMPEKISSTQWGRLDPPDKLVERTPEDHGQCLLPLPTSPTPLMCESTWDELAGAYEPPLKPPWPASSVRGPNTKWLAAVEEERWHGSDKDAHIVLATQEEPPFMAIQGASLQAKLGHIVVQDRGPPKHTAVGSACQTLQPVAIDPRRKPNG